MLDQWLAWAARSRLAPFVKLARTVRKHAAGILAYLDTKMTNGPVEGFNNKLRVIARRDGFHSTARSSPLFLCCRHRTGATPTHTCLRRFPSLRGPDQRVRLCRHHRYATARVEPAGPDGRGPGGRRRRHRGDGPARRYPYSARERCARTGLPARRRGAACRRRGGRRRRPAVSHGHREPEGGPRAHPFREPAGVRRVERRHAARRRTRKARRRNRAARAQDAAGARTIPAHDRDVVRVADLQTTAERGVRHRSVARPRRASRRRLLGGSPSVRPGRAGARAAHRVRPGGGRAEAGRRRAVVAGVRRGRDRHETSRRDDRTARRRAAGLGARGVAGHRPALPARRRPPGPAQRWVGRHIAQYAAVAGPGHRRGARVARGHRGARRRPGRRAQRHRSCREALEDGGQPRGRDPRAARAHRVRRPAGPRARRGAARGPAVVDRELRDGRHDARPGAVADQAAVGAAGAGAGRARPRDVRSRCVSRRLPADQGPHPPLPGRARVAHHGVDRRGLRRRARGRLARADGSRRPAAPAGGPVSHSLLRRAARLRQDLAGEGDRRGARPAVRERAAGGVCGTRRTCAGCRRASAPPNRDWSSGGWPKRRSGTRWSSSTRSTG